jgi:ABC-type transporter Mla subunit MlaD
MSESRQTTIVGVVVFAGLLLMALLLLNFSKGVSLFKPTYQLNMVTVNVGSMKPGAGVLMAGVQIGTVLNTRLQESNVLVRLRIEQAYRIRTNCTFTIEQAGFLGDQFVSVNPPPLPVEVYWQNGDTVFSEEPFNLQETARSVSAFLRDLQRVTGTVSSNLLTAANLASLSNDIRFTLNHVTNFAAGLTETRSFIESQTQEVARALAELRATGTNISEFSGGLKSLYTMTNALNIVVADVTNILARVDRLVSANEQSLGQAISNLAIVSAQATNLTGDLQRKLDSQAGTVGALLADPLMVAQLRVTMSNATLISTNLEVLTDRLQRDGLWRFLWRPPLPATNPPARPLPTVVKPPKQR